MKKKSLLEILFSEASPDFEASLKIASEMARSVNLQGGKAVVVGGTVRDLTLKQSDPEITLKDIDIEVFGIEKRKLRELLERHGKVIEVGVSFSVFKLNGLDISLPRRDIKAGSGHKGFKIETDQSMSFKEASRRRSFTINAMGLDLMTGELLDPWGGEADIKNRILRVVDPETFVDDSLRVLRGMQFAGRLNLSIEKNTLTLCRSIDLDDLSEERIGEEWMKLLLLSRKPSVGLQAGMDMAVLEKLHPELFGMAGVLQQSEWHPEGDVWEHTKLTVDAMAEIIRREQLDGEQAEILMLASLLHDIGKPPTTELSEGFIHSYNHHIAGLEPAERFLLQIKRGKGIIKAVLPLIREHLFLTFVPEPGEKALRRLAVRLQPATIRLLAYLIEADLRGMKAKPERIDKCSKLLDDALKLELAESMPKPILTGKMLILRGYQPGPVFGDILDEAYDAQLNGEFDSQEGAIIWLEERFSRD